ncbi:Tetratricopeptide repeat-containing protein [Streptoalloteichus tenebrarius]|uniref:Tetratricopeptide repeat-containing protein n=1 Tax=Streptoalloteichus tenebrarius (strain ATCC 17920 / DSM 40477 / JCM 4838 / CBS 697.72 / NBRC 16177 / NCIMB 11028 / NRRL B-12390 / A12253. 1 / ISP 5477) TaxID=1933 RepID=A0ABT1I467_STRSD|nr:tetratricopeptide repeat protein [Streptoalloteichus tenebrarius]MCP2262562.1 Tetratricopeptide repeat-containing protein [Streptoalloteichus tenebrarius]BFF00752.1 hypothetical protein GCM10020241_24270 [Streptoalloteichus tenebrarius]
MTGIDGVLLRAAELTRSGQHAEAVRLLRPVVRSHPDHALAWCHLAAALLDDGQHEAALNAARRAAVVDATLEWAHRLASLALTELGRPAEAVLAAREAARLKPGEWRCQVALAEALVADGRAGAPEAVDAAREAVRLAPHEARPREVLGDVALAGRRLDDAEHAYRDALRIDPGSEHAGLNLAMVQRLRGGANGHAPGRPTLGFEAAAWALLRRVALAQGVGGLALLFAGYPRPEQGLAWFGLLLCVAVAALVLAFGRRVPPTVLRDVPRLLPRRPLLGLAVVLLGIGFGLLVAWSVVHAFWPLSIQPVAVSWLATALAAVAVLGNRAATRPRGDRPRA